MRTSNLLRWASPGRAFVLALLVGAAGVLGSAAWSRYDESRLMARVAPKPLTEHIHVTTQLQPEALPAVSRRYAAVVDLRPDGEAPGQPSSQQMAAAARGERVDFSYVPVPHGEIPEQAVTRLREALDRQQGPVLLYCRSGKRAARTWALAEASRPNGLPAEAIVAAVRGAGQEADDLRPRIDAAVAARGAAR